MTPTDWRALCDELVSAWDCVSDSEDSSGYERLKDSIEDVRTALAQPGAERPPAVTIGALLHPAYEPGDGSADGAQMVEMAWWHPAMGCDSLQIVVDNARAILARHGHQPAPPAEGEVGELVAKLRRLAPQNPLGSADPTLTRAADLLEQRHPAPVPVSERLPGPEDCDAEGRCWVHQPHEACPESPAWELMLAKYASANYEAVCWLPANALPLPAGEVE